MDELLRVLLGVAAAATIVTNTNDSGPGSLREAIESCKNTGCAIGFRIPGDAPWQTIRLQSPLPPLSRFAQIDGETQREAFGDTNPAGPEIELNGSAVASGNGLELLSCGIVRGLAINGFPGNGLLLRGDCHAYDAIIERNYIGSDPTGLLAVPNQRGIWVDSTSSLGHSFQYFWVIRNNLISGNERSGVFIDVGHVHVERNIIGLNALLTGPLSNGASGVAIMKGGDGSDVDNNYIGFNHHFGVAIADGATFVKLFGNSFQANHQLAIDRGLNGVSSSVVAIPEITSVRYENGVTTIDVTASNLGSFFPYVSIYANDAPDPTGYGEGQYFLGTVSQSTGSGAHVYTFRYNGDLRGKWVSATATRREYYGFARPPNLTTHENWQGFLSATSEFSYSVKVK